MKHQPSAHSATNAYLPSRSGFRPGWTTWTMLLALVAAGLLTWVAPVMAASPAAVEAADDQARSAAMLRATDAVIGLQVMALDDARSATTLGRARRGSGVVIGADGLVLTIGYLVLEADQVLLVLAGGRTIPARVVAYDVATGFGLVQALAPLGLAPAPLGQPVGLADSQPLMIVTGGDSAAVSLAQLVSRRPFSGYWEYHIEGALFTAPARRDTAAPACSTRPASWWASARCSWRTPPRLRPLPTANARVWPAICSYPSTCCCRSWMKCASAAAAPAASAPGWD